MAAAQSYHIDSIVTTNYNNQYVNKTLYDYNSQNKQIRKIAYNYTNGEWVGTSFTECAYDGATKVMDNTYQWSAQTHDWVGASRQEYIYDTKGWNTAQITYSWNPNFKFWTPSASTTYAYKTKSQISDQTTYALSGTTLTPKTRAVKDWDASGNLILDIAYTGQTDGEWGAAGSTKKEYTYSGKTKTEEKSYTWDTKTKNWIGASNGYKTYTYNAAGKTTDTYTYTWDSKTSDWTTASWALTRYDSGNRTIETATYSWAKLSSGTYDWKGTGTRRVTEYYTQSPWVGKTKNVITYSWNTKTDSWLESGCTYTTFTTAGQNDSTVTLTWDKTLSQWTNSKLVTYTWENGINTLQTTWTWKNNAWVAASYSRTDKQYDARNLLILEATYTGAPSGDTILWTGKSYKEYEYDAAKNKTVEQSYLFSKGAWQNDYRHEWEYNAQKKKTLEIYWQWDDGYKRWKALYKYEYGFDAKGTTQIMNATYKWTIDTIRVDGDFEGISKTEDTYTNGRKTGSIAYKWDYENWTWTGMFNYLYTYNAAGKQTEYIIQRYNPETAQWDNETRYTYGYDNPTFTNEYTWADGDWHLRKQSETTYDSGTSRVRTIIDGSWSGETVTSYTKQTYYYSTY